MNVDDQLSNSSPNSNDSLERAVKSLSEYDFGSPESSDIGVQLNGHSSPIANEYSFAFANSPNEFPHEIARIANRSPPQLAMLPNVNNNEIIAPQDLAHKPKAVTLSLTCPVPACGVACEDKFLFDDHMLDLHGIKKYRCVFHDCARSFASTLELCDHVRVEHANVTDWLCSKCGKVYKTNGSLLKHLNDYHQAGHFVCSVEGCTFESHTSRRQVHLHLAEHFQFECRQCGGTFETRSHLTTHLQVSRRHKDEKLSYRCTWPGCQFKASHRKIVTGHVRIKHFKLPRFKNQQKQLGIADDRNAREFARKFNNAE